MNTNDGTTKLSSKGPHDQHEEIALRAYYLWQGRGSPVGSPEEDWFRAEQEICGQDAEVTETIESSATQAQAAAP
jgi:hypothetical protein